MLSKSNESLNENRYTHILFDLDGTLTDSGPGIMNGFAYAVKKMGKPVPGEDILKRLVGPPLKESFENILGFSSEEAGMGISFYKEYYNELGGALENSVYPGVYDLLRKLREKEKHLIVATSKGINGTNAVLDHFRLREFFDFIVTPDGKEIVTKIDVIKHALDQSGIEDVKKAVMVGDRHYDITAAGRLEIDSIGVLYGYGGREELEEAGATYLAGTAEEIYGCIL